MPKILDQHGQPIEFSVLKESQTARIASLANTYLDNHLAGLTPDRLASILRNADDGDLVAQHRLFADMEERSAHIACEMNKRKLALLDLDWDIVPPRNASTAETAVAEWVKEVLSDAVDPIEDLILALMDGVGHGFSPVEQEWHKDGGEYLPSWFPRPQEWFQLNSSRSKITLRDASVDGADLRAFSWVFHTHGKAKTGYQGRMGLHRVLSWSFLYGAYAISDFAELLETFGLPIIVGKYFSGASDDEKASLMRAVVALGHDARAIMPAEMMLEIEKITGGEKSPHLAMVDWAERSQSKAILGQTMSAESQSSGLGSGNADLHGEVRNDIRNADARQIAGTITRDVIYPLVAINKGVDSLRRCCRFVFDTGEGESIKDFSEALPPLVGLGMRIPLDWAHEKLRIPLADGKEAILSSAPATPSTTPPPVTALAALSAAAPATIAPDDELTNELAKAATPAMDNLLGDITALVDGAEDLKSLQDALLKAYGDLDVNELQKLMAAAFALAELKGMADALDDA